MRNVCLKRSDLVSRYTVYLYFIVFSSERGESGGGGGLRLEVVRRSAMLGIGCVAWSRFARCGGRGGRVDSNHHEG